MNTHMLKLTGSVTVLMLGVLLFLAGAGMLVPLAVIGVGLVALLATTTSG